MRCRAGPLLARFPRSEEHTSELQSLAYLVCRLLLEKKKKRSEALKDFLMAESLKQEHCSIRCRFSLFFFNDTATTEIYTLSLHDALPSSSGSSPSAVS